MARLPGDTGGLSARLKSRGSAAKKDPRTGQHLVPHAACTSSMAGSQIGRPQTCETAQAPSTESRGGRATTAHARDPTSDDLFPHPLQPRPQRRRCPCTRGLGNLGGSSVRAQHSVSGRRSGGRKLSFASLRSRLFRTCSKLPVATRASEARFIVCRRP